MSFVSLDVAHGWKKYYNSVTNDAQAPLLFTWSPTYEDNDRADESDDLFYFYSFIYSSLQRHNWLPFIGGVLLVLQATTYAGGYPSSWRTTGANSRPEEGRHREMSPEAPRHTKGWLATCATRSISTTLWVIPPQNIMIQRLSACLQYILVQKESRKWISAHSSRTVYPC